MRGLKKEGTPILPPCQYGTAEENFAFPAFPPFLWL